MPRALLFLLLFFLGLWGSALSAADPGADDRAAARELLAQLTEPVPTPAATGFCHDLHPDALPGFARLPPTPRALARAAMALALSAAACGDQAEAEVLVLSQELGPSTAAALLRGLAGLRRGAPAPQALSFLLVRLSLAQRCAALPAPGDGGAGVTAWLPACRRVVRQRLRRRREDDAACDPPGEREAHGVLEWVPGVSTFYNLGTSVYFAFQGCEAVASTRALEVAEDLGYAGLAALTASIGGPVALGVQLGLQPGLKAGVRALIGYFTSDGDPQPVPTAHSGPVLIV